MAKGSATIDVTALKVAGAANKYITKIDDDGITVHAANNTGLNYVQIDAEGMEIFKSNEADTNPTAISVANFGESVRIGQLKNNHINISVDGIQGYNINGTNVLDILLSTQSLSINTNEYFDSPYACSFTSSLTITKTITEISTLMSTASNSEFTLIINDRLLGSTYNYGEQATATMRVAGYTYSITYNGSTSFTITATSRYPFNISGIKFEQSVLAPAWTFGQRVVNSTIGGFSFAHGYKTTASGNYSHTEGSGSIASASYSHAEGNSTQANEDCSHAEGNSTQANGNCSHAEGKDTRANGNYSHAEGLAAIASASAHYSHVEGNSTSAEGSCTHAEGKSTTARGDYSHAQNLGTRAYGEAQTAIGKYNIDDTTSLFIIGKGTSNSARSNALTVDSSGNVDIASGAKYKINGTALSAADVGAVPTSRTINSKALSSNISLTASDVGAVPTSRTVNSKALSSDITLSAADVSAIALSDKYTRSSAGTIDWSNQTDGEAKIITKSALAYWNGCYSGTSSNLSRCSQGQIIGRNQICYANSRVDTFSSGQITIANSSLGVTTGAKPVGIILTPEYGTAVIMKYNYDSSTATNSVIQCWNHDGTAYSGAMRYFAVVFQNTWTTT